MLSTVHTQLQALTFSVAEQVIERQSMRDALAAAYKYSDPVAVSLGPQANNFL